MKIRMCPMRFNDINNMDSDNVDYVREKCAWWNPALESCAITYLFYLRKLIELEEED